MTGGERVTATVTRWPRPPVAPNWIAGAPPAALVWALGYGSLQLWWALGNTPSFGRLGTDLIGFTGWAAVGLCAATALVALGLWTAQWHWPLLVAAWAASAALVVACPLLLIDVVGRLLPGLGLPFDLAAFASRLACLTAGVLVRAAAVAYRRRWRADCRYCGRSGNQFRAVPARPPRWAWWAAGVAVAGCLVRLGAQLAVGIGSTPFRGGGSQWAFEVGFVLAGTALPLALVHPWGRVAPRWVPLPAGRRLPRWLLLGPAFGIAGGLTVYFGISTIQLAAETLTGTWELGADALPLGFFWVALPAYLAWGLGLGAAALAYQQATRPPCRVCGR